MQADERISPFPRPAFRFIVLISCADSVNGDPLRTLRHGLFTPPFRSSRPPRPFWKIFLLLFLKNDACFFFFFFSFCKSEKAPACLPRGEASRAALFPGLLARKPGPGCQREFLADRADLRAGSPRSQALGGGEGYAGSYLRVNARGIGAGEGAGRGSWGCVLRSGWRFGRETRADGRRRRRRRGVSPKARPAPGASQRRAGFQ